MRNNRLRWLSYVVIVYLLLAFTWWTVLLFVKNQDAFQAKADYMKIIMVAEKQVSSDAAFQATPAYQDLYQAYERQKWMILGEAGVFVISLMIGIWLINRGYYKEIMAAQQRRNFLLSITHELKSPIASLKLVLETLIKRKSLKKEHIDKLCGNGLKEADRLNTLVSDLLLASRVEAAYQPHMEWVNMEEMLREIVEKKKVSRPEVGLSLNFQPPGLLVEADSLGLQVIAVNLIENAVKYSAGPAKIELDARYDEVKKTVCLSIGDQGIGIPESEKKNIFDKFYRIGNEDTRKTKGTGLGLYIVDQFVRLHKGRIKVRDNFPKGTVFEVELPLPVLFEGETEAPKSQEPNVVN
jgi:two-component system phosphate regulon sensor histidine kinase PhoR